MTEDSAIRIDLHSAEVVHFTHNIWILIMWASSPHNNICHDKHLSWEFIDSSHGVAYRRGSTVVTMGPARDCANRDTLVYPGSGPLSMDFVSQEHGVPRDGPKDSNTGG
jgi:hypothetical protein